MLFYIGACMCNLTWNMFFSSMRYNWSIFSSHACVIALLLVLHGFAKHSIFSSMRDYFLSQSQTILLTLPTD